MSRPRFDPASYPGPRPAGPALVHRGEVLPLRIDGALPDPLRIDRDRSSAASDRTGSLPEVPTELRWCVAYGSNASPERLTDKGLDVDGAVLLPARLAGWVAAFEARRTGYGAVPLTLVPEPGAVSDAWLLGLPPRHLEELDRTEGRVADGGPRGRGERGHGERGHGERGRGRHDHGTRDGTARHAPPGTYRLGRVGAVAVADRFVVRGALAYLPGSATVVQHTGRAWRSWPEHDQTMAAQALDQPTTEGATRPAPESAPVLGPWPHTPLEDLPLFVYGSLRPGASGWHNIRDLVEVVGHATTTGELREAGNGAPVLVTGPDGDVHGTVLAARDAERAAELVAFTDAYDGVPERFRRRAVRVRVGGEQHHEVWATTYVGSR